MTDKHASEPWTIEFDEHGGYDSLTVGIRVGPALLDGCQYGQEWTGAGADLTAEQKARMEADARLIAAAPCLLATLETLVTALDAHINYEDTLDVDAILAARAALSRAKGEQ